MKFKRAGLPALLQTGLLVSAIPFVFSQPVRAQTPVQLPQYGIAFSTPAGYRRPAPKEIPLDAASAVYAALGPKVNSFITNINVYTTTVPFSTMPPDFEAKIAGQIAREMAPTTTQFKLLADKKLKVSGVPALALDSSYKVKGSPVLIHATQIYIVKDRRLYSLNFTAEERAFSKATPAFREFLDSVQWLPQKGVTKAK